jgi:hypothetical protein
VSDKFVLPIEPEFIDNPQTWNKLQSQVQAQAFRAGKTWEQANKEAVRAVEKAKRESAKRVAKEEAEADRDLRRKRIDAVKEDIRQRREAAKAERQLVKELADIRKQAIKKQESDEKAARASRLTGDKQEFALRLANEKRIAQARLLGDRQAFALELSNARKVAAEKIRGEKQAASTHKALQREIEADAKRSSDRELAAIRAQLNARKSAFNEAASRFNQLAKGGTKTADRNDRNLNDTYEDVRKFGRNGIRMLAREGFDRTRRLAGNSARAAGLDFDVFDAGRRANELSQKALVLATQSPDANSDPIANAGRVESATKNVSAQTGIGREDVFNAVQKYMELTGNLNDALSMLPDIAKRSVAFGTAIDDVAESFATIRKRLGDNADAKAIARTFDIMGSQGRAGAVEIREFAKAIIPRLGPYATGFGVSDTSLALSGGNKEEAQLLSIVGLSQAIKGETRGNTLLTGRALESFANQFMGGPASKRWAKDKLHLQRKNARGEDENLPLDEMIAAILMHSGGDQNKITSITQNQPAAAVLRAFLPEFNTAKQDTENMFMKKHGFSKPSQLSKAQRDEAIKAGGNAVVQAARMKVWGGGTGEGRVDRDFSAIQGSDASKLARTREQLNQQLEQAGMEIVRAVANNAPQISSSIQMFSDTVKMAAEYPRASLAVAFASPGIAAGVSQVITSGLARLLMMGGLGVAGGAGLAIAGTAGAAYYAGTKLFKEDDFLPRLAGDAYEWWNKDESLAQDARNSQLDSEYENERKRQFAWKLNTGGGSPLPPEDLIRPGLDELPTDVPVPQAARLTNTGVGVVALSGEALGLLTEAVKRGVEAANIEIPGNPELPPHESGRTDWVSR